MLLTDKELINAKNRRRLSFGFAHSWEYNNTDVTHDFEISGIGQQNSSCRLPPLTHFIGNLHKYLQSKFDAKSGIVKSDEKRKSYILDSANAKKLRLSIANFASLHSRVNSAPPGPLKEDLPLASLSEECDAVTAKSHGP